MHSLIHCVLVPLGSAYISLSVVEPPEEEEEEDDEKRALDRLGLLFVFKPLTLVSMHIYIYI